LKVYFAVLIAVVIIHRVARSWTWREIIVDLVIDIIVVSPVWRQFRVGHACRWWWMVMHHCVLVAVSTFRGCSQASFLIPMIVMLIIVSRALNLSVATSMIIMNAFFPLHKW